MNSKRRPTKKRKNISKAEVRSQREEPTKKKNIYPRKSKRRNYKKEKNISKVEVRS